MELIEKHNIAIWPLHDYWHAHKPDRITMGNLIKLEWQDYYNYDNKRMIKSPKAMTSKAILKLVKKRLGVDNVRFIGDLKQTCSKIYLAFSYHGCTEQIAAIQKYKPDLILSGETREWEMVERVRDGRLMGEKTFILVLSHSLSEEAGIEYAAEWLRPQL
ncbi:MAG: putative NIF3 family GTP cyclohydrolase 1 type 2 [Psychroserpens sp.]|jgi:putative NIF3 family GTP cyclohydrolase 1 type 2